MYVDIYSRVKLRRVIYNWNFLISRLLNPGTYLIVDCCYSRFQSNSSKHHDLPHRSYFGFEGCHTAQISLNLSFKK